MRLSVTQVKATDQLNREYLGVEMVMKLCEKYIQRVDDTVKEKCGDGVVWSARSIVVVFPNTIRPPLTFGSQNIQTRTRKTDFDLKL